MKFLESRIARMAPYGEIHLNQFIRVVGSFTSKMKFDICYTIIYIFANIYFAFTMTNCLPDRISRKLVLDTDTPEEKNLTIQSEANSMEYATEKHSNKFRLLRNENATANALETGATEILENKETTSTFKPNPLDDPEWTKEYEMNELIFMSRNNCNLELQINEWEDRKLKIQYESLKTRMFGQCKLSLRGKNGIFLAFLVSNIQLNGRELKVSPAEVLRVVVRNNHFDYILKEYYGNETYYPMILTETDQIYLILLFNGTNSEGVRSSYNLEVFNYYKRENTNVTSQHNVHYNYGNSTQNVDSIFITTSEP